MEDEEINIDAIKKDLKKFLTKLTIWDGVIIILFIILIGVMIYKVDLVDQCNVYYQGIIKNLSSRVSSSINYTTVY